jgi:quinol-cytochrome oxidoreductase complex cytochrome b subunit
MRELVLPKVATVKLSHFMLVLFWAAVVKCVKLTQWGAVIEGGFGTGGMLVIFWIRWDGCIFLCLLVLYFWISL